MNGYNLSYFQQINLEEQEQANRLAAVLLWKYAPRSVIDIGCATGLYLKPFWVQGIRVLGVDSSASVIDDSVLVIPKKFIQLKDITKENITKKADLALCIEVMEHIDANGAQFSIKNISKVANTIFFTAAQPGQGGVGHINCQPKDYWDELFTKNGFHRDVQDEDYIRLIMASGYHMGWLINNLMIFKK